MTLLDNKTQKLLEEWARRQILYFSDKYGRCESFEISHATATGKANIVSKVPINKDLLPEDIPDLCREICNIVVVDVDAFNGVQKYKVMATFENHKEPVNRFVFRLINSSSDDDNVDLAESEPANQKGLLTQLMRHNEASHKISVMATSHVIEAQNKTIMRQATQIENMQAKQFELVQLLEDLMSRKHTREIETAQAIRKEKAFEAITDKLMLLMPMAVNKLSGKNLLPEKTTSGEQMLLALVESLKPEQMNALTSSLHPEQQMLLFQIYENMRNKFEKNKEENSNG